MASSTRPDLPTGTRRTCAFSACATPALRRSPAAPLSKANQCSSPTSTPCRPARGPCGRWTGHPKDPPRNPAHLGG
eukprot:4611921-Alexandrium_andersonii.AAC.1